jgi:hypothetical protein
VTVSFWWHARLQIAVVAFYFVDFALFNKDLDAARSLI